jgi:hypothetical protein
MENMQVPEIARVHYRGYAYVPFLMPPRASEGDPTGDIPIFVLHMVRVAEVQRDCMATLNVGISF